jgi:hypothetical protein
VDFKSAQMGMEAANLPPSLINANSLNVFIHYWFYQIWNFFHGMFQNFLLLVKGRIPDGSFLGSFYSASVGMLVVSVAGLVFWIFQIRKTRSNRSYQIYFLVWLSWFLFPKATAPRFILAYSAVIFLLSFRIGLKFWITRVGKSVLAILVIFAILSPAMAFASISRSQVPFYRNVEGNSDLLATRCPTVVIAQIAPRPYLSLPGFSSAPLLDQMCTVIDAGRISSQKKQSKLYFYKLGPQEGVPACVEQGNYLVRADKFDRARYLFTKNPC